MGIEALAARLAERMDLSQAAGRRVLDALFDPGDGLIVQALAAGGEVAVPGFGRFALVRRKGRTARNPRTGEPVEVPPHRAVSWKPAAALKRRVNP